MTQDLKVKLPPEMKIQSLSTQLQLGELSEHTEEGRLALKPIIHSGQTV